MTNRRHPAWLPGVSAALAGVAILALASGPAATAALSGRPAPAVAVSSARPLLLLNGDRVVSEPGRAQPVVRPAAGGGVVLDLRVGGQTALIPAAALPYLGHGLTPGLFQLATLRRAETGGRLPLELAWTAGRPRLPGVTITRSGDGHAAGYLTARSAPVFYAALARQFRADHGRASYGDDGLFAGGLTMAVPGTADARQHAARPRPGAPMSTLTVTGTNLAGKPDTGDEALVINAADWKLFGDPIETVNVFYHGTAKFSVPAGTYWAVGEFATLTSADTGNLRIVVLPQFTVAGARTTVHLAERAASSELGAATPRPAALQAWVFGAVRGGRDGTLATVGAFGFQGDYLWVSPTTRRPTVGTLRTYETQTLASRRGAARPPYVYNLALAGPAGIIPDQHTAVSPGSLATVTERFYQDVAGTGDTETLAVYPVLGVAVGVPIPLPLPGTQTEYMTGSVPSVTYQSSYSEFLSSYAGGQSDAIRRYRAGQQLTEDWNQYPLHPQPFALLLHGDLTPQDSVIPSAFRMGSKLYLYTPAFGDNTLGHTGAGFFYGGPGVTFTGRYAVYQDGAEIAHGSPVTDDPFAGLPPVSLSSKPAVIRYVLSGARQGATFPLSPAFQTAWTWRSHPEPGATLPPGWICTLTSNRCAVQPLMTLDYQVHGLALNGSATPGAQAIGLTVGHLQLGGQAAITSATMQFSLDGGKTWQPATVTRTGAGAFRASFTAPAGSLVTLRTSAADNAGGAISETIQDAYRVS
jgi:hypothetical protein